MRCNLFLAAVLMAAIFSTPVTQAASLYWDTNGTTAGSGAATGTWGTDNFWNTDAAGGAGTFTTTTTSADNLFIAAGTNGTTGTITVSGTQSGNSITLDDNVAITISGGTGISLGSTSGAGLFISSGDNAANAISTPVTLGAASTIQTAGTGVLTVSGGVTGAFDLSLKNNSTNAAGITISTGSLNNTGNVSNSGVGTGGVAISSVIGTNLPFRRSKGEGN